MSTKYQVPATYICSLAFTSLRFPFILNPSLCHRLPCRRSQLTELRVEAVNRLRASQTDMDNLAGPKAEAEELLGKERALAGKEAALCQVHAANAEKNVVGVRAKAEQLGGRWEKEKGRLAEREASVAELEASFQALELEHKEIAATMDTCQRDFTAFERKDIKYREDIKHAEAQAKKLGKAAEKEATKQSDAVAKNEELAASVPALEAALEGLKVEQTHEAEALEAIQEENKEETGRLAAAKEAKEAELEPWATETAEAKVKVDTSSTELELLESGPVQAREQLAACEATLGKLAAKEEALVAGTAERAAQQEADGARLQQARAEAEETTAAMQPQDELVRELRTKFEEGKAARGAAASLTGLAKTLGEAAKRGGPLARAGFLGRLGDLGAIDADYDVAISTACGALDNFVVETSAGGKSCLAFMRANNVGRGTFIALDKIGYLAEHAARRVETPEDAPRLFDLVQFDDERLRTAFFFAVRNTLVAKDLDQAVRIAYEGGQAKWRVVTMKGELIETTGTMSGGGNRVQKGRMGAAAKGGGGSSSGSGVVSEEEVERIGQELAAATERLTMLQGRADELRDEIRDLERRLKRGEKDAKKATMDLASVRSQWPDVEARADDLKGKTELSAEDEARAGELRETVSVNEKAFAEAKKVSDAIGAEVTALQEQIMGVGGDQIKKQRARVTAKGKKIDAADKAICKATVDAKTALRDATKAGKAAAKATSDQEKCLAKLEKTRAEFAQIEEDALEVMQSFDKVKSLKAEKEDALEEVRGDYDEMKKELQKIKVVSVDIEAQMEEYTTAINANEQKAKWWTDKIAAHKKTFERVSIELGFGGPMDDFVRRKNQEGGESKAANVDAEEDVEEQGETKAAAMDAEEEDAEEEEAGKAPVNAEQRTLVMLTPEQIDVYSQTLGESGGLKYEITMLVAAVEQLRGNVNMGAIAEYRIKEAEHREKAGELNGVDEKRNVARAEHEKLRKQRLDAFMSGFQAITLKLKEMYQMITLGGDAELELVDSLDPFSEGIVFSVRPPKKSWKVGFVGSVVVGCGRVAV